MVEHIDVRILVGRDIDAVSKLDSIDDHHSNYTKDEYAKFITKRRCIVPFVVEVNDEIAGACVLMVQKKEVIVLHFFVTEKHRRNKAGTTMIDIIGRSFPKKDIVCCVPSTVDGNEYARQAFMEKSGYHLCKVIKGDTRVFMFRKGKRHAL